MVIISDSAASWAHSRGLSRETLASLPVASGLVWFPDLGRKSEGLFFRYEQGWKARSFPDKSFVAGGNFKPSFWNIEQVLQAAPGTVFITEGECDAASLVEAGLSAAQVLSVPTGARKSNEDPRQARAYGYVLEALAKGLGKTKRFVWCGDDDDAGLSLRADMLRILGAARFYYVTWPEGIKDPNDMLTKDGAGALRSLVTDGALPWPQAGLYRLSELPEPPPLTIWKTSLEPFEGRIHFAPKTLSVCTGNPGHGKSLMFCQIFFDLIRNHGLRACIASFETRPKPHIRRQLRTLLTNKLEMEMSDSELAQADDWINDRYLFLNHPDQRPTLEWLLECAETAVVRHGVRIIQIDPWNRLEAMRDGKETETEYILRCLRAMYVFAQDMDCLFQVVVHPAKMDGSRRGHPPTLEDCSGSRNWENIIDQGFVIHRPQMFEGTERKTEAAIYHRKARFEELGFTCKILLRYDLATRKYIPLEVDDA